ncbi:GDSL esterase/lipase [Camellia lanceoleosa]|uniref:GDSL esterase/lipase n=1 Tax=Camellia lanceoleosa TaxID=1840588 RepID=A0ACC0F3R8_9ERIC|nr:GDSL esterase/lipase [Camellia lanceoleosa]
MLELIGILVPLVLFNVDVGAVDVTSLPPCNFPAIYNFGDSNSAALDKNPAAGHLLIEYMADYLKLPYVSGYPNSSETKFQYGANFASSGASIRPQHHVGGNSVHLKIQVQQFGELKARSSSNQGTNGLVKPEDFSKALYTLDIGQNDLTISYQQNLDVRAQIPDVINQFTTAVKDLYELGARAFWIHNTAPFGCIPFAKSLANDRPIIPKTEDQHKCNTFMNEMSKEYNRQLHEAVNKLRVELPNAALTYVDLNTPMYELLTAYTKLGFADLLKVAYDTVHRSQSASLWLSNRVVNGSLSEPPIPINYACLDVTSLPPCNFPAIYNFGDSNSAALDKNPAAGHLLIEYMADYLKLPYVSGYPNSSETKFQYGANFASSGASIRPQHHVGGNSVHLKIQVQQFGELKARSSSNQGTNGLVKPEDFSKALYTLDIGQNDLTISYQQNLDVRAQIPDVINQFTTAVKDLYELGARAFWIHNTAPFGCIPFAKSLANDRPIIPKTEDQHKCNTFMNEMSKEYNRQLHEAVNKLRVELPNAALTYVDLNTPMYELLTAYTKLGFADLLKVAYDTVHRSQSASLWLSNWVVNGSLSEPPIPINYACRTNGLFKPEDFSKALYTLDIGQNDLTISYQQKLDVRAQIPDIINQFTAAVKDLYQEGARAFWIHNTAPFGCFPFAEILVKDIPKTQDQRKCYTFMNEMSKEYNRQLHEAVNKLRVELPKAALTYVDLNTPMYELLTAHTKLGIQNATYDSVHRTQLASQWLSNWVVNGSVSEPPIPINYACPLLSWGTTQNLKGLFFGFLQNLTFDVDARINLFEIVFNGVFTVVYCNIRVLGGLVSAHILAIDSTNRSQPCTYQLFFLLFATGLICWPIWIHL